jgi:hypothetical protein
MARRIALAAGTMIVALLVVGLASGTELRHTIQVAPLWVAFVLGARHSPYAKWVAAPMFVFWLLIMALIWLYLLGIARIVDGQFSTTEIAMTLLVAAGALAGMIAAFRQRTAVRGSVAAGLCVLGAVLQVAAMWISLQ